MKHSSVEPWRMQAATKASVAVALCTAVRLHGPHVLLLVEAVESSHNTEGEWGVL